MNDTDKFNRRYFASRVSPLPAAMTHCGCGNIARLGSDKCGSCLAKDETENNRRYRVQAIVEAHENLIEAKIADVANTDNRLGYTGNALEAARFALVDLLLELLP